MVASAIFAAFSCRKEQPPAPAKPDIYWGFVKATKNGSDWASDPFANINNVTQKNINFKSDLLTRGLVIIESFSIWKIPFIPGRYKVFDSDLSIDNGKVGAAFYYKEDDLPLGDYAINEADTSNFVELLSYDSLTREIKGRFSLSFKLVYKPVTSKVPDTVVLRNGEFHTRILK